MKREPLCSQTVALKEGVGGGHDVYQVWWVVEMNAMCTKQYQTHG